MSNIVDMSYFVHISDIVDMSDIVDISNIVEMLSIVDISDIIDMYDIVGTLSIYPILQYMISFKIVTKSRRFKEIRFFKIPEIQDLMNNIAYR